MRFTKAHPNVSYIKKACKSIGIRHKKEKGFQTTKQRWWWNNAWKSSRVLPTTHTCSGIKFEVLKKIMKQSTITWKIFTPSIYTFAYNKNYLFIYLKYGKILMWAILLFILLLHSNRF